MRLRQLLLSLLVPWLPAQAQAPVPPAPKANAEEQQAQRIQEAARRYRVPAELVAALVKAEAGHASVGHGSVHRSAEVDILPLEKYNARPRAGRDAAASKISR